MKIRFRLCRRLSEEVLNEINEMIIECNTPKDDQDDDDDHGNGGGEQETNEQQDVRNNTETAGISGTLIIDATCAPQNIKYPQDIELLNEAREKLEDMICRGSDEYNFYRPRMYREKARKDYLALAK